MSSVYPNFVLHFRNAAQVKGERDCAGLVMVLSIGPSGFWGQLMVKDLLTNPSVLWACVSGCAAVFAALTGVVFPLLNQKETVIANKAGFYLQFTERYNTPEMHEALLKLTRFHNDNPSDFASIFTTEFARKSEIGRDLDRARREVNRYFVNVAEMHINGFIDRKLAAMLCNFQGLNIFYKIVVPMNVAKYGALPNAERLYSKLKRIRPQYEDGTFGLRV